MPSSARTTTRFLLLALALIATRGVDAGSTSSSGGLCSGSSNNWFSRLFCRGSNSDDASCPTITTVSPFDLSAYVESHPWYVQQQQPNGYQPIESLFCVRAAYAFEDEEKTTVSVLNTANDNGVDGPSRNARGMLLRAVVPDPSDPSKLAVGPRFVPKAAYGPYWVVAVGPPTPHGEDDHEGGPGYDWAVISGGQPNVPGPTPNTCRTALTGTNGSGLWIFTRSPLPTDEVVLAAMDAAVQMGFDLSEMKPVVHDGCEYPELK